MRKDMSKKKKTSLILIAFFVVMALSVSVISYSIATRESGSKDIKSDLTNRGAANEDTDYITNIDCIIEDSYLMEADGINPKEEAYYKIVEIMPESSRTTDTGLKSYITNGGFKKYVIDNNKDSAGRDMKPNMIRYTSLYVSATTALSDAIEPDSEATYEQVLNSADLIYVNSPKFESYRDANDMGEAIFNWLVVYSTEKYKPIIMDYIRSARPDSLSYGGLIWNVYRNYIKYRTFFWNIKKDDNLNDDVDNSLADAEDFFKAKSNDKFGYASFYLPFNVDENATNGTPATGKILVISNNSNGGEIAGKFRALTDDEFIEMAYFGSNEKMPSSISYEYKTPAALDAELTAAADPNSVLAKGKYDFIILENDSMNDVMEQSTFDLWNVLSMQSQYIIYDKKNAPSDDGDDINVSLSYYYRLMDRLISDTGIARYDNVLPVSRISANRGFFELMAENGAAMQEAADQVADLINGSDYRGNSTTGGNGRVFRVLELQPCYPIDLKLASTLKEVDENYNDQPFTYTSGHDKGNYYTKPAQMIYGLSEDEHDGTKEYYKFELSRAKIAEALGLKYAQVRIDQMSTEEFISDKRVVLETYDLVYIGGDYSALIPQSFMSLYGWSIGSAQTVPDMVSNHMPRFSMYTHTGYPVELRTVDAEEPAGAPALNGKAYGSDMGKYVTYNGNDLTRIKMDELKNYIKAGMPILFSSDVTQEYDKVAKQTNRMNQLMKFHLIDPDSNMYELLTYASTEKKDKQSIVWNFDVESYKDTTDPRCLNENKQYGPSLTNYVSLLKKESVTKLVDAYKASNKRPSLKIVSKPVDYQEGVTATYNENVDGTMTITVSATAPKGSDDKVFDLKLYVDADGNGMFSEDEVVAITDFDTESTEYKTKDLVYNFHDPNFFGIINWKVIAYPSGKKSNECECDVANGYAYYKRKEEVDKKEVNVLQIMPRYTYKGTFSDNSAAIGEGDGHSLYLCTECQMATYRADYNIYTNINGDPLMGTRGNMVNPDGHTDIEMGLHKHQFGIVKYDANGEPTSVYEKFYAPGTGAENWDDNFADLLADDYEFNLDIMYLDDLKLYSGDTVSSDGKGDPGILRKQSDAERTSFEQDLDTLKEAWDNAKNSPEYAAANEAIATYLREHKNLLVPHVVNGLSTSVTVEVTDEMIEKWIQHEAYYRAFWFLGYGNKDFNKLYQDWVDLHNDVVRTYEKYREYKILSSTADEWMSNNYDVVVLGFAENFGAQDLTLNECEDVRSFVDNGGTLLTTHDSTTRYEKAGAVNLTRELRDLFGMDRYHMTVENDYQIGQEVKYIDYDAPGTGGKADTYYIKAIGLHFFTGVGPFKPSNKNIIIRYSITEKEYELVEDDTNLVPVGDKLTVTLEIYDNKAEWGDTSKIVTQSGSAHYFQLYAGNTAVQDGVLTSNGAVKYDYIESKEPPAEEEVVEDYPAPTGTEVTDTIKESIANQKFVLKNNETDNKQYDANTYFMTPLSTYDTGKGLYVSGGQRYYWEQKMKSLLGNFGKISPVGVTDSTALCESSNGTGPYLYGETSLGNNAGWANSVWDDPDINPAGYIGGTNRATRNNTGIITTYPFTLGENLRIAKTHAQTFALDLEDPGMSVWYSLAGCDGTLAEVRSSMFAASPKDGMDSYFLYTRTIGDGFVNYCGAGHSCVTGVGRDNNDERRLYINLVVNAVRNKGSKPVITLHEKEGKDKDGNLITETPDNPSFNDAKLKPGAKTKPAIDSKGNYTYNVESDTEVPEFNYKVLNSKLAKLENVKIFYDLDYGIGEDNKHSNTYPDTPDADHILVYEYMGKDLNQVDDDIKANRILLREEEYSSSLIGRLRKDLYLDANNNDLLKLKPEYFTPYGNYTYMVIWAKDENGKTAYQRVKIKLKEHLFDLTDAGLNVQNINTVDMTDKSKFNI